MNAGTQRPSSPDGSLATETRKPGSLNRVVSLTTDLEECRDWIEMLEALAWRCHKQRLEKQEAACVTLLAALTLEREDKETPSQDNEKGQP